MPVKFKILKFIIYFWCIIIGKKKFLCKIRFSNGILERNVDKNAFIILSFSDQQEINNILTAILCTITLPTDPYKYLKQYWIVTTTGAFLLVILVGKVTLFNIVFMIFFLLYIFVYEVSVQPVCVFFCFLNVRYLPSAMLHSPARVDLLAIG